MQQQPLQFNSRSDLIKHVASLCQYQNDNIVSSIQGGHAHALTRLHATSLALYAKTRNHLDGKVTMLSPYIRHGAVSLEAVRQYALTQYDASTVEKFLQELTWRHFWQAHYAQLGDQIWEDIEPYKTGWSLENYSDELPEDIVQARTGVAVIDYFSHQLTSNGYLHNHARMYLASYIVHWRKIRWQAGAQWFLTHLLDGDIASNNLSWQWVASTFSQRPYIFNLDNVRKYATDDIDTSPTTNSVIDASYDILQRRLFPHNA